MRLGIIGCGTIAATYKQALEALQELYRVTALYDILPENARMLNIPNARICAGVEELAALPEVDCVVISTPIHTHSHIAAQCLRKKKHVLMEKPATMTVAELTALYDLAQEMGVVFHVAFHSSFGADIDWYLEHQEALQPQYRKNKINSIECRFFDPYMPCGQLLEDRKALGGSYIDSGVNILSVCSRLTSLEALSVQSHQRKTMPDGLTYASQTVLCSPKLTLTMHTGWDMDINHKSSVLHFTGTENTVVLDHTDQSVRTVTPEGKAEVLYRQTHGSRMVNQYIRVFRVFFDVLQTGAEESYKMQALAVHKLLFSASESCC